MPDTRVLTLLGVAGVVGLAAGLAGAAMMLARARRGGMPVDLPDDRRLHTTPTPRGGGLGLPFAGLLAAPVAAILADTAIDRRAALVVVLVWALPNGLMGFIDDFHPMRSRVKFAIQASAAIVCVALGLRLEVIALPPLGTLPLGIASWPVSVLWLVWTANVYNFMDGMDALAATSGAIFFAGLAALAATGGAYGLAAVAVAMIGGSLGFLRYNAPPAKIFMGDAGSLFVGAVLGGLALALTRADLGGVPITASVLVLGTFVWDATFTIARRALRGEAMLPHRTHLYQRLALGGWSHGRVRIVYFVLALLLTGAGVVLPHASRAVGGTLVGGALAAALALTAITYRVEARRRS